MANVFDKKHATEKWNGVIEITDGSLSCPKIS